MSETTKDWRITVDVPLRLPLDKRSDLFTAVADTVHDWEDAQTGRDWDALVAAHPVSDDAVVGLSVFLAWLDEHPDRLYEFEHDHPALARRLRRVLGGVHNHASGVTGTVLQAGHIQGPVTFR